MPVLVVGPGRCGTSLAAGVCHKLGINMGTRLMPGNPTNPLGHFEDLDFHEIHERLFFESISFGAFIDKAKRLIAARTEPWGLKDPRLCPLLPFYLGQFERPTIFRCRRRHHEVVQSFMKAYPDAFVPATVERIVAVGEGYLDQYLGGYDVTELWFHDRQNTVDVIAERLLVEPTQEARDFVE